MTKRLTFEDVVKWHRSNQHLGYQAIKEPKPTGSYESVFKEEHDKTIVGKPDGVVTPQQQPQAGYKSSSWNAIKHVIAMNKELQNQGRHRYMGMPYYILRNIARSSEWPSTPTEEPYRRRLRSLGITEENIEEVHEYLWNAAGCKK